ncbi:MAG: hypothetical protein ABGZ36_14390, partial [Actinomycetota bacterium]
MAESSLVVDRTDADTAVADRPTTTPVRRDSRHDRVRRRRQLSSILRTALILAGALIMLFPFAWMVATSLTNESQLFGTPRLIPDPIDTTAYRRVADTFPLWRWMANSIGIAVVSTTLQVITSAMAAYA